MIYNNIDLKLSITSVAIDSEIKDFNKLLESVQCVQESNIIVLQENVFKTIWDKIKDLWAKFKKWLKKIIGLIKEKFSKSKKENDIKKVKKTSKDIQETFKEAKEKIDRGELKVSQDSSEDDNSSSNYDNKEEQKTEEKKSISWEEELERITRRHTEAINRDLDSIANSVKNIREKAEAGDEAMQKNAELLDDLVKMLRESDNSLLMEAKGYYINIPDLISSDAHKDFTYLVYTIQFNDDEAVNILKGGFHSLLSLSNMSESMLSSAMKDIKNIDRLSNCVHNGLFNISIVGEKRGTKSFHDTAYIQDIENKYIRMKNEQDIITQKMSSMQADLDTIEPKDPTANNDLENLSDAIRGLGDYFRAYIKSAKDYIELCKTTLENLEELELYYKKNIRICRMFAYDLEADLRLNR